MIVLAAAGFSAVYSNLHVYICGMGTRQVIDSIYILLEKLGTQVQSNPDRLCGVPEFV